MYTCYSDESPDMNPKLTAASPDGPLPFFVTVADHIPA
jgi:hypothetical protein